MINQKERSANWKPREKTLHVKDLKSAMAALEGDLEHLRQKFKVLPKVEEDGSSECPFAEDLYAAKEEAVAKVTDRLQKMRGYLPLIEREISRCTKNRNTLNSDRQKLHDENAREQYQFALHAQQYQYQKAVDQKKALLELIRRAEQLLKHANAKQYQGKKPEKRFRPPLAANGPLNSTAMVAPDSGPPAGLDSPSPSVTLTQLTSPIPPPQSGLPRRELGNLLALGPLSGKLAP